MRRKRRFILVCTVLADTALILFAALKRDDRRLLLFSCGTAVAVHLVAVLAWRRRSGELAVETTMLHEHEPVEERPEYELSEEQIAVQESLARAARTLQRCYRDSIWVFFGSLCGAIGLTWMISGMDQPWPVMNGVLWTAGGMWALGALERRGNAAAKDVAAQIRAAEVEVTGAIIDFMHSSDPRFHEHALKGLEGLLRRMRPEHAGVLNVEQRRFLYARLKPAQARLRPSFALAVLGMVEQIRDGAAEPFIQGLLAMSNPTTEEDKSLLSAAYFALQSLDQANEDLVRRGTLLSPASAPAEPKEWLLRPRASQFDEPASQLLRVVDPDDRQGA